MSDQEVKVDIFKERIFPVLFMLIVTVVFIALVSGIYLATRDNVLRNERLYLMRAVLYAADIQVPEDAAAIESRYNDLVQEVLDSDDNLLYYELEGAGYVFPAFGPGLWGEIEAARFLYWKAAWAADRPEHYDPKLHALAKTMCSETAMRVTVEAIQVFGGYGSTKDFPMEKYVRDAVSFLHSDSANQLVKVRAGNCLAQGL